MNNHTPCIDRIQFHGNKTLRYLTLLFVSLAWLTEIYCVISTHAANLPLSIYMLLFGLITVVLIARPHRSFTTCFLISTFTMISSWRLAALAHFTVVDLLFIAAIIMKFSNYIYAAYHDIKEKRTQLNKHIIHNSRYEWQLLFIRMFIGYDLIPHFCEKLFAGSSIRAEDIHAFTTLGVPHAATFVLIAGLCELGGAIAISCGILTRLGAICLFLYLMVATYLGHHFSLGFIWASPGGGWEYPVLWASLTISFACFGASTFSIDQVLKQRYKLPNFVLRLMGGPGY